MQHELSINMWGCFIYYALYTSTGTSDNHCGFHAQPFLNVRLIYIFIEINKSETNGI